MAFRSLYTARGEALRRELARDPDFRPWDVYPRPRLARPDWINLNGVWDFGAAADPEPVFDRKIVVPFPPESLLSGVASFEAARTPFLFYRRRFTLDECPPERRLLLHLDGADRQVETVLFNGQALLSDYSTVLDGPLTVVLPEPRQGENLLEIRIRDDNERRTPWGKQREKRGGMWYTPVSGLWQTVWLEWVPEPWIADVRCEAGLEAVTVQVFCAQGNGSSAGGAYSLQSRPARTGTVLFEGREYPLENGRAVLRPETPRRWTPEDPHLYPFTMACGQDRADSYFALRTVEIGEENGVPRLLLNGRPYFFNGLLDQGYWSDGLWTPADPACFEDDLRAVKALGFNMVRKHIKLESQLFYAACDRLGVAVFQDLINSGRYSFLRDTALPTLGLKRLPQLLRLRSRSRFSRFLRHMQAAADRLGSHPCVVYWTVYNEGWGQQYAKEAYARMKALAGALPVDTASGWFRTGHTDVESLHVYFRRFRMPKPKRPAVLSEFGGYVWKEGAHSFNPDKTYGYRLFESRQAWQQALEALYREQILPAVEKGLCAAVYTQLSDVEDETNGLLTYDRRLCKLPIDRSSSSWYNNL